MYNKNEIVHIKWTTRNKNYYENLGYEYTKIGDPLDVLVDDIPKNSNIKITASCDCENCMNSNFKIPYATYNKNVEKHGKYICKSCIFNMAMKVRDEKSKKRLYDLFLDKCVEHNCIPITTYDDFQGSVGYVKYICPIHGETQTDVSNMINSNAWCYMCGKMNMADNCRKSIDEVKQIVEGKNNNILLNPDEYKNMGTKNLRVICGSCNDEYITSLSSIENSKGMCLACGAKYNGLQRAIDKKTFLELATIDGTLMCVDQDQYISFGNPMDFYCSECGDVFTTTPNNYIKRNFTRCKKCHINSYGEQLVAQILDKYHINYETQYKFDTCIDKKPLPFDFYLIDDNVIIEYDGIQHYYPVFGQESFEMTIKHDKIKNKYCFDNGIKIIRIPYYDMNRIEEILKSELQLIDIKLIDISKIH